MPRIADIRRKELRLTQAEFSSRLGVNQTTVSRWERGILEPSASDLQRIRTLVEELKGYCPEGLLFLGTENENTNPRKRGRPRIEVTSPTQFDHHPKQKTIASALPCRGVGIHTGARIAMVLNPAPSNTGIVFQRTDKGGARIPALWHNIRESPLCTTLTSREGVQVASVEHIMAALAGAEIDNILIELDGPEVPIMDGSAEPFLFLIERAGIIEQDALRRAIKIMKPVYVSQDDHVAGLTPSRRLTISMMIDFPGESIAPQAISVNIDPESFRNEIARARTFGFLEQVERLRASGLARGGSLDNAVVVADGRVLNTGGLRFADEFVRHKALDAIGDLYLAGAPMIGHFTGTRSGHWLYRRLLRTLFADDTAWRWTTLDEENRTPATGTEHLDIDLQTYSEFAKRLSAASRTV